MKLASPFFLASWPNWLVGVVPDDPEADYRHRPGASRSAPLAPTRARAADAQPASRLLLHWPAADRPSAGQNSEVA